ncbi:MAG: NAD(P)-binding protein, partial [Bacteroidota bacterium]
MIRELALGLSPEQAADKQTVRRIAASLAGLSVNDISEVFYLKRSIDARKKNIRVNLKVRIVSGEDTYKNELQLFRLQQVNNKPEVLIAGSGPAGLFAALQLIEEGYRPLLFERGPDVHTRKKDIAQLNRDGSVNTGSNYCFGEGGAGTFSDGKLYTRSVKRGNVRKVTDTLFQFGAPEEILYDSHPHIGTDKLPSIVEKIRNTIIECG